MVNLYKLKIDTNIGGNPIWRYMLVYNDSVIANFVSSFEQDDIAPAKLYTFIKNNNNLDLSFKWNKQSQDVVELTRDGLAYKKIVEKLNLVDLEKDFE